MSKSKQLVNTIEIYRQSQNNQAIIRTSVKVKTFLARSIKSIATEEAVKAYQQSQIVHTIQTHIYESNFKKDEPQIPIL